MKNSTLVMSCSPRGENGTSNSIAEYLTGQLESKGVPVEKVILRREISNEEHIIYLIKNADTIVLTIPIYQNSIPGMVMQFFELLYKFKNEFSQHKIKLLVLTNSGFAHVENNKCAIETCRLFAEKIGFYWLGGAAVAPGTLMSGSSLQESKGTYKKLIKFLDCAAESVSTNKDIDKETFNLLSKSFINSYIYTIAGYLLQRGVIKKTGKEKYFAKPFEC